MKGWSAKLILFQDEANRQSREAAKAKAMEKVEELLIKLRKINTDLNELNEIKEGLENKIQTDDNRDMVRGALEKELQGVGLKIRWANDEKKNIFNDLETALKILEDKNNFIDA